MKTPPSQLVKGEYGIGAKVYVFHDSEVYGSVSEGTVINVTPSGRYSIEVPYGAEGNTRKLAFMPSGRQVGHKYWDTGGYYIVPKADQEERAAIYRILQRRARAASQIHAALHSLNQYSIRPNTIKRFKADIVKLHQFTNDFIDTLAPEE